MKQYIIISLCIIVFFGCTKKVDNPLSASIPAQGIPEKIDDPLEIGLKPVAPLEQKFPSLIQNQKEPFAPLVGSPRDFVSLMNQGGGILTIWASANGSWIWAHAASYYSVFGDAYNWKMEIIGDGLVRFVNKLTRTCLNVYGSGVIHYTCSGNNPSQFFKLLPMKNGAIAIQSAATKQCLQTGFSKRVNHPIITSNCLEVENSEQQWLIIPAFIKPTPVIYP